MGDLRGIPGATPGYGGQKIGADVWPCISEEVHDGVAVMLPGTAFESGVVIVGPGKPE